jgi:uncharacterized protein (UPF0333 family)
LIRFCAITVRTRLRNRTLSLLLTASYIPTTETKKPDRPTSHNVSNIFTYTYNFTENITPQQILCEAPTLQHGFLTLPELTLNTNSFIYNIARTTGRIATFNIPDEIANINLYHNSASLIPYTAGTEKLHLKRRDIGQVQASIT